MDLPVPSYNARQGRSCFGQRPCLGISETYLQAFVLRNQASFRLRRRGPYTEKVHFGEFGDAKQCPNTHLRQNERKKKKAGAAASHARIAEKLLAAQMRREALNHAGGAQ